MSGTVLFLTESEAQVDQFISEYVVDAIDRAEEIDGCEGPSFDRDEQLNPDGDSVVLVVFGDFDTFVESERERWQTHQQSGLIEQWKTNPVTEEQAAWKFGERGAVLAQRLMPLGAEMATLVYEQFDDDSLPAPVDAYPEDDGWMPVGWWAVFHHLTVGNLGYSPTEEIDMCVATIEEDLRLIAEREGPDAVDAEIDTVIDAFERLREDVKDGRPQPDLPS